MWVVACGLCGMHTGELLALRRLDPRPLVDFHSAHHHQRDKPVCLCVLCGVQNWGRLLWLCWNLGWVQQDWLFSVSFNFPSRLTIDMINWLLIAGYVSSSCRPEWILSMICYMSRRWADDCLFLLRICYPTLGTVGSTKIMLAIHAHTKGA
jgi:hypothetical protein